MAKTLNGRVSLGALFNFVSGLDLSSVTDALARTWPFTFLNGVGADQANALWHDERTLGAGAAENLDLAGGLVDAFGAALTFTRIKAVLIRAATTNQTELEVTRPANGAPLFNAVGDGVTLPPGAAFALVVPDASGVAVTAGTGDLLRIENMGSPGDSAVYDIILVGTV